MLTLPEAIMPLLEPFCPLFHRSTWVKVQVLLVGAILAVGKRTVTSALRVMGVSDESGFAKYHHVLNRAVWSSHRVAEMLLALLMVHLDKGTGPLVFGIDETMLGAKDHGPGHLSRCGALEQATLCQDQWSALDQYDVADMDPLGPPDLGLALSHRARTLGRLL